MSVSASSSGFPELEKYELLEEIGHGGMATVYRARDLRLDREVAVKIIHKHLRENAEVRRRFVSEARAVAKLRHPGIVDVYDVSAEEDEERYLVVELVRGTTLRKLLTDRGSLPAEIAAAVGARLCEAIEHAHSCGVIHRDVKPENVLIEVVDDDSVTGLAPQRRSVDGGDGEPHSAEPDSVTEGARHSGDVTGARIKITDFGIAKVLDTKGVTSTGQILGSPAHMAPEQIEGGEVGPHTDVFALGVLLYECMVGHLPFEGKNPAQVLRHVLDGHYEPADAEQPMVGGRWANIISQALERDPTERLPSASALAELLREELTALGIDEPDVELSAYFADPEACDEALAAALVPRLLQRGERARREGLIHQAAADFNRALAFRPNDLAILKRVSALTAQSLWKQRTVRLVSIAVGSALLFLGAYGVTRVLRPASAGEAVRPMYSWLDTVRGAATVGPLSRPRSVPSALPSGSAGPSPRSVGVNPSAMRRVKESSDTRKVRFSLIPKGANLTLDGQSHGSPFGRVFELAPGPHSVSVTVPPGSKCCKPTQTTVTVQPAPEDDPDAVQNIVVTLEVRPSTVTLVGAPAGAQFSCPTLPLTGAGGVPATVTLPAVVWTGFCEFSPGGKQASVVLQAGQSNSVPWPGGGDGQAP